MPICATIDGNGCTAKSKKAVPPTPGNDRGANCFATPPSVRINYSVTFSINIGVAGEENLRLDIDWRDPSTGAGDTPDLRLQSLYFDHTLIPHSVTHDYSFLDFKELDCVSTTSMRSTLTNTATITFGTATGNAGGARRGGSGTTGAKKIVGVIILTNPFSRWKSALERTLFVTVATVRSPPA